MTEHENNGTTRRDFLARAAKAAACIAAAGFAGWKFHDTKGPAAFDEPPQVSLPDFSIPDLAPQLCVAHGSKRARSLTRALEALGGMGAFVSQGDRVLLKVNAAFATPAMLSATTHPDTVRELTRLCFAAGAASVIVTDNPINDPQSCFELTGIAAAAREAGATVELPRSDAFRPITLAGGTLIRNWPFLHGPFKGVNKLIGVTPVKDHDRSGASMTMKNWYGLLGGRRNVFHQEINEIIKELALLVRPTLVVLDGTTTMMRNGPTGGSLADLKQTDTMIVGTDQVAADAYGATLLGRRPSDLPYITMAAFAGAGTANYQLLNPIEINGT